MAEPDKGMLCVGGVGAGRWIHKSPSDRFVEMRSISLPVMDPAVLRERVDFGSIAATVYEPMLISAGSSHSMAAYQVPVLAPVGMEPREVLRLLLEGYRNAKPA
jgi:hypothetical protein